MSSWQWHRCFALYFSALRALRSIMTQLVLALAAPRLGTTLRMSWPQALLTRPLAVRALQRFADEALDVLEAQQSSFSDGGAGKGVPGERRFGFHVSGLAAGARR
jgi:hypothetical protein